MIRPLALASIALVLVCQFSAAAADQVAQPPIIRAADRSVFVASDAAGNLYVAGSFFDAFDFNPFTGDDTKTAAGASGVTDVFVTRFNADGSYAWTQTFGGSNNDEATAIAVANNRVYVTGMFRGIDAGVGGAGTIAVAPGKIVGGTPDAFVLALNAATGSPVTTFGRGGATKTGVQTFGGTESAWGEAVTVAAGTVFVAGNFSGTAALGGGSGTIIAQNDDFFVLALDGAAGTPITTFNFDGIYASGISDSETAYGLAVSGGTLFVAGGAAGPINGSPSEGDSDAFVLALDRASGAPIPGFGPSAGLVKFAGGSFDVARAVAVSDDNTVYISGFFFSTDAGINTAGTVGINGISSNSDLFVVALNATTGAARTGFSGDGIQTFGGDDLELQAGAGLVARNGVVYVAGYFESIDARFGQGTGGTITVAGNDDAVILALDGASGEALTGFSTDGAQTFGGADPDRANGLAFVGETLIVSGFCLSNPVQLGGAGAMISNQGLNGFLLRLGPDGGFAIPSITSAGAATGTVGVPFNFTITATNNPTAFFATGLPAGLSINMTSGAITGTPAEFGLFDVGVSVGNVSGTRAGSLQVTINPPPPAITSVTTATATKDAAFSFQIMATNSPTGFGATGLPAGLSIVAATGQISGTPTVEGEFDIVVSASNGGGTGTGALKISVRPPVPLITSPLTATGTQNQPFSYAITATGSPTAFNATGLPAGLSVSATTGVISGIPTALGASSITLSATNPSGTGTATLAFNVVLANAPALSALDRTTALPGEPAFMLTVSGSNFLTTTVVTWNGGNRPTTFVSATQLTVAIPASDLAVAGRASVAAVNPSPGGGTSNVLFFSVYNGTVGRWVVKNTNDSGVDSLRFCLEQARAGDLVTFDDTVFALANSDAATIINVESQLPPLDDGGVTLDAQGQRVTVNGSGASSASGLVITSDGNAIRGLSLIGFPKSAINLRDGAAANAIGGNRTVGVGPNGQGLRLSSNGSFGIEIVGAGTDGNTVKGCWIGLAASGVEAQPNLAGVLIQGGAKQNVVGSDVAGEENAVSGNVFEGLTVSGDGTDDNVFLGNLVGISAVDASLSRSVSPRAEVSLIGRGTSNGSAGLFLSKGTKRTRAGGTGPRQGNTIAFNGGNGIEVRSQESRGNSATSNRITRNVRGGIALFDNSNNGVARPVFTSVEFLGGRGGAAPRATASARVQGTAASGTVEIFNDDGSQGSALIGRGSVTGGTFDITVETDGTNLTATVTDSDGNTSPFAVFGGGGSGSDPDSDGDGVSDPLEDLAGTDPLDPASKPVDQGALSVDKLEVALNFAKALKDAIKLTTRLTLPTGFAPAGSELAVRVGGASERVTLTEKGVGPKGNVAVKLKGATAATLTFSVKGKSLAAMFASQGLTNRTTAKTGEAVTVPVAVALVSAGARIFYVGSVSATYKATQGKTGKARK